MRAKIEMLKNWPDIDAKIEVLEKRGSKAVAKALRDGIACKKGKTYFVSAKLAVEWVKAGIARRLKVANPRKEATT